MGSEPILGNLAEAQQDPGKYTKMPELKFRNFHVGQFLSKFRIGPSKTAFFFFWFF